MQKIAKITRKFSKIMKKCFFYNFLLQILIFFFHFYFLTYQIYCLHAKTGCFLKKICHVDLKKTKKSIKVDRKKANI